MRVVYLAVGGTGLVDIHDGQVVGSGAVQGDAGDVHNRFLFCLLDGFCWGGWKGFGFGLAS